ncbi:MAG: nitrilase family protein [Deltaproteobacteria bacterium]|nr:nitrilase family protein [Deltaproteobacteria bacterium]MBW2122132.1 nitrilase family protein [Deltaproteobacteria bacterium]
MERGNTRRYGKERTRGRESLIKVAAIQMEPHIGDKEYNIQKQLDLIEKAAKQGARLMVLPELGNTGYIFNTRDEVSELAEEVPDGPSSHAWIKACKELGVYICAGIAEREGGKFYNSAALVGPDGFIGKYRKLHLWDEEKLFFEPGDLGIPVFHLPFGRVGIMICYDGWHPEVARILALQGADIICDPTCWVLVPDIVTPENPVSAYVHMASAHVNGVFMICADRCGTERDCVFLGNSCIAGPAGFVSGPAGFEKEEVIVAEINVVQARYRHWTSLASPLADRRTDVYDSLLGYRPAGK